MKFLYWNFIVLPVYIDFKELKKLSRRKEADANP